jgi:hypothetical protein
MLCSSHLYKFKKQTAKSPKASLPFDLIAQYLCCDVKKLHPTHLGTKIRGSRNDNRGMMQGRISNT